MVGAGSWWAAACALVLAPCVSLAVPWTSPPPGRQFNVQRARGCAKGRLHACLGGVNWLVGWQLQVVVVIDDYGAKPDGTTLSTGPIQHCIALAAASPGGGVVVLPDGVGTFVSGALFLESNVVLYVGTGTRLLGAYDKHHLGELYPRVYTRGGGTMLFKPSSLINGGVCLNMTATPTAPGDQCAVWKKLSNVTITGGGTIDGNGHHWYGDEKDNNWIKKPTLLGLLWVEGLTIEGLTLTAPPSWTIHPIFCTGLSSPFSVKSVTGGRVWATGVVVRGINVQTTMGPFTDGCDPDSCTNVLIENSTFNTGDDCIAVKSGKDLDGRLINRPSAHILVRGCRFEAGHGVSIGSEMSGGVYDVTFEDSTCHGTQRGVRIKTCVGRGGTVEGVRYRRFDMSKVGTVVEVEMHYYELCSGDQANSSSIPHFRNISITDVHAVGCDAGQFDGLPQAPITDVLLENVEASGTFKCDNVFGKAVNVTPTSCLKTGP